MDVRYVHKGSNLTSHPPVGKDSSSIRHFKTLIRYCNNIQQIP